MRPDQTLSFALFLVLALLLPISAPTPVKALKPIVKLEPLPILHEKFFYPELTGSTIATPRITAKAAIVYDLSNGAILFEKGSDTSLPEASLTKLMTALVASELYSPDEIAHIDHEEFNTESNVMGLRAQESITVENLLKGLLIYSANDAALALAHHHPQGYSAFIAAMNKKALKLHLKHTQFQNPVGFDDANHYSTVYDLAILSKEVLQHPKLAEYMSTELTQVTNTEGTIVHPLTTTNLLLNKLQGVVAGKTGITPLAGECLFTEVSRENHSVITVVLGSQDRFTDTTQLVNWVYNVYTWNSPVQQQIDL